MVIEILQFAALFVGLPYLAMLLLHGPIERRQNAAAAKLIRERACPHCGGPLTAIEGPDLMFTGVRVKMGRGMRILWDRVPRYRLNCPQCAKPICIDRSYRATDCSRRDYLLRDGA
jgi:hypothetical protein